MDFLPISKTDLKKRGWNELDVILITGDAYVDHPSYGVAVIGRVLEEAGHKVGIIAQPDWRSSKDFLELGRPRLFFGITSGNVDSMIANYSANKKERDTDDYSPGGKSGKRPDRAAIVYANKIREVFGKVPIVLGGIECSLRRLAHYDYWDNDVRRSMILDTRADMLVYGMGERQIKEIADRFDKGIPPEEINDVRGTVVIRKNIDFLKEYVMIPSFEEVKSDIRKFNEAFKMAYYNQDAFTAKPVVQKHADRFVIQFPPAMPLSEKELDAVYELPYLKKSHPVYDKSGGIKGIEPVRFSIVSHRGCCGECAFCGLYFHQGRIVQSRGVESIVDEARRMVTDKDFRGTIRDVGGPTVNMYAASCRAWQGHGACKDKKCLYPKKCQNLILGYKESIDMYRRLRAIPGVKHVFLASGFRHDLLADDEARDYLDEICRYHISGQMKVAPEYLVDDVLRVMNKSSVATYAAFEKRFRQAVERSGKQLFLVNYFISAHPGATMGHAVKMGCYLADRKLHPEQVQDFIPLPMTLSGCIYHTGAHPFTGEKIYTAKTFRERKKHRALMQYVSPANKALLKEVLNEMGLPELKRKFGVR